MSLPDEELRLIYADLHLHIGRTAAGEPVKISGSRELTFRNIAEEASLRKGIGLLGVIDAHSPGVQSDIIRLLENGEMTEGKGGGIRYNDTTILLGAEIEVRDEGTRGAAHLLAYMPTFEAMQSFTEWMSRHMRNVRLSSQRIYVTARRLQEEVKARGGLFIPAHIFTPYKSLLGSCTDRIGDVLDPSLIDAVELGLSADSEMAGWIPDLDRYPFLTNSDAHSLRKIGREYNAFLMAGPSFEEFKHVLLGERGRAIKANYGLNPRLGKYHRTYCLKCGATGDTEEQSDDRCPVCGGVKLVSGVMERIARLAELSGRTHSYVPADRPPYIYQVPLEFVPGIGPKLMERLLDRFGTEMNILHQATQEQLAETAGEKAAKLIVSAREGTLRLHSGGGGRYGRVQSETADTVLQGARSARDEM
ncbi:endonuclease Q family protein [Paenibacillus tarimensis]